MKKVCFLMMIGVYSSLMASLYLYNDSPFPLKAEVIGANGVNIGSLDLAPQQLSYMTDQIGSSDPTGSGEQSPQYENYNESLTPYSVFWYCPEGSLYSSCQQAFAGATVTANSCSGSYFCKSPKKQEESPNPELK
jgi:hypothetical protein